MLKSMTAYGRAAVISSLGRFIVEIHSVNRKHLEINTFLPRELLRFDADIKKWIAAEVGRGQVNVKVSVSFDRASPLSVIPNKFLAKQIKSAWEEISTELGFSLDQLSCLDLLSKEPGLFVYDEDLKDEELYRKALNDTVSQALQQLTSMKMAEGNALYLDISSHFFKLTSLIREVAVKAPGATARYRQRLIERLEEVLKAPLENEERILREVCIYAERIDISEELTRFESHLQQANALLQSTEQAVGKTLEFLVQELNREINTIGSKSSDLDVSRSVIEIKSELEKIREQIQNIE